MNQNLTTRDCWLNSEFTIDHEHPPDVAPFADNFLLLSKDLEKNVKDFLEIYPSVIFQPVSKQAIWISSKQPITERFVDNENLRWELCSANGFKRFKPKLISFDMDSTLIAEEVIDEIARDAGCYEEVSEVTEQAMRGELDFDQSLIKRVALIQGLELEKLDSIASRLTLSPGAIELLSSLNQQAIQTAILSGGFDFFATKIAAKLNIPIIHSNQLEIHSRKLTGEVIPPIVNAEMKAKHLFEIATTNNIDLDLTMAVGDGANDLKVLSTAGLGIAWHAKPKVAAEADVAINYLGLEAISWIWE